MGEKAATLQRQAAPAAKYILMLHNLISASHIAKKDEADARKEEAISSITSI